MLGAKRYQKNIGSKKIFELKQWESVAQNLNGTLQCVSFQIYTIDVICL